MSRRFPQELIDQVRTSNDIVDVISERIQVKKAGRNYKARCPFHQEKTPSFNINPERQIYHCFGCGAGGNVLTFVMEYDKLSFPEAVRELARRAGITLERSGGFDSGDADPAWAANDFARRHFSGLLATDSGRVARDYFAGRGLTDETVKTFALGYAQPGWDGLLKAAGRAGIRPETLEEAGLVIRREDGGHYDRFRDRLVFPLLTSGDRTVGFGGRAFGDQQPKYLNSPETRIYRKGTYLYGLSLARPAMRASREVILVEGYMDLITLYQAGFHNVVASAGTALTPEQAKTIDRYADKVFLAYDGDSAGIAAATRAAETLVQLGVKVRVALMPGGSDPDSYLRENGPDALRDRLAEAVDFIDFLVSVRPMETPDDREAAARSLIETVSRIEDPLRADLMLGKIASALSIGEGAVRRACERAAAENRTRRGRSAGQAGGEKTRRKRDGASEPGLLSAQKGLLAMLLAGGQDSARIRGELGPRDFEDPLVGALVAHVLENCEAGTRVDASALIAAFEDPACRDLIAELSVLEPEERDGARLCDDYIRTVRRAQVRAEILAVDREIESAEMTDDDAALLSCAARRQELARRLRELSVE